MKKYYSLRIVVLIFLACAAFSGCNSLHSDTHKELTEGASLESGLSDEIGSDILRNGDSQEDDSGDHTDISANDESENDESEDEETQQEYKRYSEFLNIDKKVVEFFKEDIDLDGDQEVILVYEHELDTLDAYVLRETGDRLQKIGEIKSGGYGIYAVNLVKMRGSNHQYINTRVSNGISLVGFALYKVKNDELITIAYCASPTGDGVDTLTSSMDDGIYDGYLSITDSYDVMFFNVCSYYKWNGESFEYVSSTVDPGDYPFRSGDVVTQYLQLSMLWDGYKSYSEVVVRLNELNISKKQVDTDGISNIVWGDDSKEDWLTDLQWGRLEYEIQETANSAVVTVPIYEHKLEFTLTRNKDKWQITDIKGDFVIS